MMIMKQIEKASEKYALECQKEEGYPSPMYDSYDAKDMRECAFKSGAEWQIKQSPWISVKDRLPELGDPVLIRLKDGTVRLAVLDTDDNSDVYFWSDNYSYETISGWDTTHWMPIPPLESNDNE